MTALLHEVCSYHQGELGGYETVNAFLGNLHVKPLSRIWQTTKTRSAVEVSDPQMGGGRNGGSKTIKKPLSLNYLEHCKLPGMYDLTKEKAEIKISKHALLEALFGTQVWAADYIRNPFIYITDNE